MKPLKLLTSATALILATFAPQLEADTAITNAYDNADLPSYAPFPDNYWSTNNGGYGYAVWTPLGGVTGGGTYMDGVGQNYHQLDGSYSFGLYYVELPGGHAVGECS